MILDSDRTRCRSVSRKTIALETLVWATQDSLKSRNGQAEASTRTRKSRANPRHPARRRPGFADVARGFSRRAVGPVDGNAPVSSRICVHPLLNRWALGRGPGLLAFGTGGEHAKGQEALGAALQSPSETSGASPASTSALVSRTTKSGQHLCSFLSGVTHRTISS